MWSKEKIREQQKIYMMYIRKGIEHGNLATSEIEVKLKMLSKILDDSESLDVWKRCSEECEIAEDGKPWLCEQCGV